MHLSCCSSTQKNRHSMSTFFKLKATHSLIVILITIADVYDSILWNVSHLQGVKWDHCEVVLFFLGSCPAPMAVGEVGSGKSTALDLTYKLLGGKYLSQSSGESVSSDLVRSSLPVFWDDPTYQSSLKSILVSTLQAGGKQTKSGGNEIPQTTFLLTVNFNLADDMRLAFK